MTNAKQEALLIFTALLKEEPPPVPVRREHEVFLLSWCEEHGAGGFLYKQREKYLSAEFSKTLQLSFKKNLQRNLIFLQEYQTLRELCLENDLPPPVALKGLALLQRVQPIGVRPLTDIDLYIEPKHLKALIPLLESLDYEASPEKKWRANHHKSTFSRTVSGLSITLELHTQLFYNQPADFVPPTIQYGEMTILAPDIELVYLSAHLVHQHTFLKLFWLMDLDALSLKNPDLWTAEVWVLARRLRVVTSLGAVGFCLNSLFDHRLKLEIKFLPMKFFLKWPTLILLNESRFKYLCMKHTSKDSLKESLLYDLRWLYFRMENSLFANKRDKDIAL